MKKLLRIMCLVVVFISLTGCFRNIEKVSNDYSERIEKEKVSFEPDSVKDVVENTPGYESHNCFTKKNIIYITIVLESDSSIISGKSYIKDYLLEEIDVEVLKYYSISVGITNGVQTAMGMKQPGNKDFSWSQYEIE